MTPRQIRRRQQALRWFAADPADVLFKWQPSRRMINILLHEGLVMTVPVGSRFQHWKPTSLGKQVMKGCGTVSVQTD